jgi:hypothetical protein
MKKLVYFSLLLGFTLLTPATGSTAPVSDHDMKAALIYNFAVFIAWPEENHMINVCAFEEDQDNVNRDILESKEINGMPVHFVIIRNLDQIKSCQILYLEETKKIDDKKLLAYLADSKLLSILNSQSSSENFAIIKMQLENNKYTFTINNQVAKQANLTVSSKLLRLATKVY